LRPNIKRPWLHATFVRAREAGVQAVPANAGLASGTINKDLSVVRRVLNLAARVWRDENGLSWLSAPPLIQFVKGPRRRPYPLAWDEQTLLFKELLARMCLFKVNAGLREQEVCRLR
jgi:integrase